MLAFELRDPSLEPRHLPTPYSRHRTSSLEFALGQSSMARRAMAAQTHRVRGLEAALRAYEPRGPFRRLLLDGSLRCGHGAEGNSEPGIIASQAANA